MSFFSKLVGRPRQPDIKFAADGFFPIAIMQINNVDTDLHAIADGYAQSLLKEGCSANQMLSANWGGVSAIGQDLQLFQDYAATFEQTLSETGRSISDPKAHVRAKYRAAATIFLSQIMSDAPGEYERFLRYIGR